MVSGRAFDSNDLRRLGICLTEVTTTYSGVWISREDGGGWPTTGALVELGRRGMRHLDRLLDEPIEQESTGTRASSVEAKRELVQVVRELSLRDTSLVCSKEPALDERGHLVGPRQLDVRWVGRSRLVDDDMIVPEGGNVRVSTPAVREDGGAGLHHVLHEGTEARSLHVRDPAHSNTAEPLLVHDFHGDRDDRFALGLAAPGPAFDTSDVGFVDLNDAIQPLAAGANHRASELMEPRPRSLVALEAQDPLEPQGIRAVLLTRDLPCREKPGAQRPPRPVEDGPGQHGAASFALLAHEKAAGGTPGVTFPTATRADEAAWPPQSLQVRQAARFIGEELVKLKAVPGVVHPRREIRRMSSHDHNI